MKLIIKMQGVLVLKMYLPCAIILLEITKENGISFRYRGIYFSDDDYEKYLSE